MVIERNFSLPIFSILLLLQFWILVVKNKHTCMFAIDAYLLVVSCYILSSVSIEKYFICIIDSLRKQKIALLLWKVISRDIIDLLHHLWSNLTYIHVCILFVNTFYRFCRSSQQLVANLSQLYVYKMFLDRFWWWILHVYRYVNCLKYFIRKMLLLKIFMLRDKYRYYLCKCLIW